MLKEEANSLISEEKINFIPIKDGSGEGRIVFTGRNVWLKIK